MSSLSQSPGPRPQNHLSSPEIRGLFSTRRGIISFLLILAVALLALSTLLFSTLPELFQPASPPAKVAPLDDDSSVILSHKKATPTPLPANQALLVEQHHGLALIPTHGGPAKSLATPGYSYNQAVPPVLLPSGQILYSGNGIWITSLTHPAPRQLVSLPVDQVLTSLVVNDDASMFAWSTSPTQGKGLVKIYAGPLEHTLLVYQSSAALCPCLRAFSFLRASATQSTLLLSDDRSDHYPVNYGLWSLDLTKFPEAQPQLLRPPDPTQGPLAFSSKNNTMLYAPAKGFVPAPTDSSVPDELASQSYANSLSLLSLDPQTAHINSEQEVVPVQRQHSNSAEYHWVTTPRFSLDGGTLAYILFSSDVAQPYDRHNALYLATLSNGQPTSRPQLLASSMADFIELGPWLSNQFLSLYADGSIYILDTQSNGLVRLGTLSGEYTRILSVVKQG